YKIYEEVDMKISIKTRLGRYEPDEIEELMDIYNKYPLEELVIHPRVRDDYYMGEPRLESFSKAYAKRTCPICYNGDIFVEEDYNKIERRFPMIAGVMMGRGILADPGLLGRIHGEEEPAIEIWRGFHQKLYDDFRRISVNEEKALFKMKEIWCYLKYSFPKYDVWNKGIKKAQDLKEYEKTVKELFDNYPETPGGRYRGWHQNHPKQIRVQREKNMQMENWEALYQKALRIAAGAHEGQVDKGGHPYIGHPLAVAQKVNGIEEKIAALLHDVVEDTEVTIEELGREFPEEIVKAVDLLTKKKEPGFSQQKYLEAIRANPLARNVKLADLEHNMDINRIPHPGAEDYLRTKRYQNSRDFLTRKYD
ncbi:MAG: HD domain-containing protein, partial [Clostridia bacterium]|nr:HD domain-containing protein [Clostridia bacterium]